MGRVDDLRHGVGARLRAERERLKLNQEEMGERGGKNKQTQLRYESGVNSPTANYLHGIAELGVDIGYVLTGFPSELHDEEAEILSRYRMASGELRRAALAVLTSGAAVATTTAVAGDNSGQVNVGPVMQGSVSFQVGSKKSRSRKRSS